MLCDCFKSRRRLEAEILVLRHQLNVLQQRPPRRLPLRWADRALFIWLRRRCPRSLDAVTIVSPSLQGIRHAGVARSRRRGVTVAPDSDGAAPDFQYYEAAADAGKWDRAALECAPGIPGVPRAIS
jgi:hypothetical protein